MYQVESTCTDLLWIDDSSLAVFYMAFVRLPQQNDNDGFMMRTVQTLYTRVVINIDKL